MQYMRSRTIQLGGLLRAAVAAAVSRGPQSPQSHRHLGSIAMWAEAAKGIDWIKTPQVAIDESNSPFNKWFPDGTLNTCFNAVDRHVSRGNGQRAALIFDSPVTNTIQRITYSELQRDVMLLARVLLNHGVRKGDVVIIYMPMIPEAIAAMLACARIGAVHSVVFGGFAANELAIRIKDSSARIVLTASCGIDGHKLVEYKPLVDEAIDSVASDHTVDHCIVLQREQLLVLLSARDTAWADAVAAAEKNPVTDCAELASTDPLYVLYTSGTTSAPKGVLRDNGGHAVALNWAMHNVYGLSEGDVFWAASDIGWVVGHSCCVYGPLIRGCTSVIYEGKPVGTPDEAAFWRVIEQHKVNALYCAPTALRAIKLADPDGVSPRGHSLTSLRHLLLVGERADAGTVRWAKKALGVPVLDHWWQTETGWPVCANMIGEEGYQPQKEGSCFKPCKGWNLKVLRSHSEGGDDRAVTELSEAGAVGALALKLPLPPGFMLSLFRHDERFVKAYMSEYPGYYSTGDLGHIDEDGYVFVTSRAEDEIKIAGHRISTGSIEEVLCTHPAVGEVAVVGVIDSLKGQIPVGLVVLHKSVSTDPQNLKHIEDELVFMIREKIGPVAVFKKALFVPRLPKTRSGKILRGVMRKIADGEPYVVPATIEDMGVLKDIEHLLVSVGDKKTI